MKICLSGLVLVSVLSTLIFSGCSAGKPVLSAADSSADANTAQKTAKTIRVTWWGNQIRNDRTEKVLKMYHDSNPNIAIKGEYVDWNGYWDKLATQTAANSIPDIMQMDCSYINQYTDKSLLANLRPYSDKGYLDLSSIPSDLLAPGIIRERLYGVPLGVNALVLYYDQRVFSEAGIEAPKPNWNWKQYEDMLTMVFERTGKQAEPILYRDPIYILEYMVRQQGKSLYSPNGEQLGFSDPETVEKLFELLQRLTKRGIYVSPDKYSADAPLEESPIAKGETFMGSGWSNQYAAIVNSAQKPYKMISLPSDGAYKGLYNKPSMFFSVFAESTCKVESIRFINYFINNLDANRILLAERGVPASSNVRESLTNSVDKSSKAMFDYIDRVNNVDKEAGPAAVPPPVNGIKVSEYMKYCYETVAFDQISPHNAAVQFMQTANKLLDDAD